MLVNHLSHSVAKQDHILIKRFNLTLKFDPVNEINGYRHMLTTECVEKWVLQKLTFIIAHDMFRVQKLLELDDTTALSVALPRSA